MQKSKAYKVSDLGNAKVVIIEFNEDAPEPLKYMEIMLHQSTGGMPARMKAAKFIQKLVDEYDG